MKRLVMFLIFGVMISTLSAQNTTPVSDAVQQVAPKPKTDKLKNFHGVKIDGPMNVTFVRVESWNDARITYDTKGCETSKFKYNIDRSGVLAVSEKSDSKRTSVTDVTIYYRTLDDVKVAHAKVEFKECVMCDMFDISLSGGAIVSLSIDALDVAVECTGRSNLTLSGDSKYLTMRASAAKVDCGMLSTVATTVDTSNSAEVRVWVSERLEVTTSTGGKLLYRGTPTILRHHKVLFGGDIININ